MTSISAPVCTYSDLGCSVAIVTLFLFMLGAMATAKSAGYTFATHWDPAVPLTFYYHPPRKGNQMLSEKIAHANQQELISQYHHATRIRSTPYLLPTAGGLPTTSTKGGTSATTAKGKQKSRAGKQLSSALTSSLSSSSCTNANVIDSMATNVSQ